MKCKGHKNIILILFIVLKYICFTTGYALLQLPDLLLIVFRRGKWFYRQIQNNNRSNSASSTALTIELDESNRQREERPIARNANDIVVEDYNPEREDGARTRVTNNTEDMAGSRYTEDIVKLRQEMLTEGINSIQQQITRVDEKLDKLDGKLTRKIDEIEHKIEKIDTKI